LLTRQKVTLKKKMTNPDTLVSELLMDASLSHAEADIKWLTLCEMKIKAALKKK
jgi:hypothetical protein